MYPPRPKFKLTNTICVENVLMLTSTFIAYFSQKARHWNPGPDKKPVLCVHGWKDNAATFDTLLPLLVKEVPQYQFVAIDLPGHGLSTHFPPGMLYLMPDIWLLYRRVLKHFNWEKISIVAHSMGAQFSFMFAGTHPNTVDKLVSKYCTRSR